MGMFSAGQNAGQSAGFLNKLSTYLIIFAIIIALVNCGILIAQQHDYKRAADYLFSKVVYSTLSLDKDAYNIMSINQHQNTFFLILNYIWVFLNVYLDFMVIVIWIKCLWYVAKWLFTHDDGKTGNTMIALLLFFVMQILALALKRENPFLCFISFYDLFVALISLGGGRVKDFADQILPGYNSTYNTLTSPPNVSQLNNLSTLLIR